MESRLRTGIDVLDRKLDGGLPAGSIVALTADPASQAELFLYEMTATRQTLYLTLSRTSDAVIDGFSSTRAATGQPTVRDVTGSAPLDTTSRLVTTLPESCNLIIDPANILESQDGDRYRNFLNELRNHISNTNGVAVLHCLDGRDIPARRDTTEHMADVIFDLETRVNGDRVENRLTVPKFRGGRAIPEVIKLELADRVAIDTSRDIA